MSTLGKSILLQSLKQLQRSLQLFGEGFYDLSRVANFARGLVSFEVRPDDVFIVTYPRSGTTLMQYLLHQLCSAEPEIQFEHISQVAPWFERSLAVGALDAADLEALPSPRVFKSHLAQMWTPRGARTIYVTRDVGDVAVSYYHFYRSHLQFDGTFDQFFERFVRGDVQYGSWFKHTAGWRTRRDDASVLFLRFEELVSSLRDRIEIIARFLDIAAPAERLDEIAERCSFAQMKRQEERFDFSTELLLQRGHQRGRFLRSGQVGQGSALAPEQRAVLERLAERSPPLPALELDLPAFLR